MSFARLIHDYIEDFAADDDRDAFDDFDDEIDSDDHTRERHARRHRRSGRRGSQRRGRGRSARGRSREHRNGGSTRDLVRLVVLTVIAIGVIRRLRAGRRRSHRREYA